MESYEFLLVLAIILLSTKLFGLATEKVHLPQVVGALLAGIVLGPSVLGFVQETDFLVKTSEIGVIMLMFIAGLDTDLEELKETGRNSLLIALAGVIVPLAGCGLVYHIFYPGTGIVHFYKVAFIGVVFAATSVGITIETLNEMGKLKTKVGTTLVSAAIIDDIIGIVALSIISGFSEPGTSIPVVGLKIIGFFVFVAIVGGIVRIIFKKLDDEHGQSKRVAVWGLAFCFLMSYSAEKFFGVADITGAYFAGLLLCNIAKTRKFLAKKMTVSSYVLFSPVFFASIGIKTNLTLISGEIILFAFVLLFTAIITKIIGCGFVAKIVGMSKTEAVGVGVGMVSRGEVALMVAQKGIVAGMIAESIFPAIVLVVIMTSLLTPILLNITMKNYNTSPSKLVCADK